jgi:hypothetical protein
VFVLTGDFLRPPCYLRKFVRLTTAGVFWRQPLRVNELIAYRTPFARVLKRPVGAVKYYKRSPLASANFRARRRKFRARPKADSARAGRTPSRPRRPFASCFIRPAEGERFKALPTRRRRGCALMNFAPRNAFARARNVNAGARKALRSAPPESTGREAGIKRERAAHPL